MMHRILVMDDNPAIHNDIRKMLARPEPGATSLEDAETLLFGEKVEDDKRIYFDIDSAFQGQEGLELVGPRGITGINENITWAHAPQFSAAALPWSW